VRRGARRPFENLRAFVEFWADEKDSHTCCLFATDEELEEPVFDCDTCPVRQALDGLRPENEQAWRLFHRLGSRFVVDFGVGAEAFKRLTADVPDDEVPDLLQRLALIYDGLYPPPKMPDHG